MSLIADALKRAQEQRKTTGQSEDKARRMLTGSGPLRVESRQGTRVTRPLALAGVAVVAGAIALGAAIVLAPSTSPPTTSTPAVARVSSSATPSGSASVERGAGGQGSSRLSGRTATAPTPPEGGGRGGDAGALAGGIPVPARDYSGYSGDGDFGDSDDGAVSGGDDLSGDRTVPGSGAGDRTGTRTGTGESEGEPSSFSLRVRGGGSGAGERSADEYYGLALGAHQRGELERAVSLYRSALELRPDDAQMWNNLGAVYRGLSMPGEAIAAFRRAVESDRGYAPAWSNLGLMLDGMGRSAEAIEAFQEALEQDPTNTGARVNLANVYQGLGMISEARGLLGTVLRDEPSLPEAHYGLARLLEQEGEVEDAVRHYRLFLTLGRGQFPALEERVAVHVARLEGGGS